MASPTTKRLIVRIALGFCLLLLVGAGALTMWLGPHAIVNTDWVDMTFQDARREGTLKVGDPAPDLTLLGIDGRTPVRIGEYFGVKPTVLMFGSLS